jgi:hypothetical protein
VTTTSTMSDRLRLKIKIPKSAWNAYDPQPQPPRRVTRAATRAASRSSPSLPVSDKQSSSRKEDLCDPPTSPVETTPKPKSCKVKLWGLHHGGPKRLTKGALQNEVIYETPCLQPTCSNCLKWHPHLMREQTMPDHYFDEVVLEESSTHAHAARPEVEPLSPEIDPHIIDGTWRSYQSRRSSSSSALSSITCSEVNALVLTPVKTSFFSDLDHHPPPFHVTPSAPSNQLYNIWLATSLLAQTATTAPATTTWRSTPRRRYTARLTFASHEGKGKFRDLIRKKERKAKRQEYDRAYRARKAGTGKGKARGKRREEEG